MPGGRRTAPAHRLPPPQRHPGAEHRHSDSQRRGAPRTLRSWVAVEEVSLSYYNKEALLFATDPHFGNLSEVP